MIVFLGQRSLEWLTEDCSSGDILVLYFSGCSARVPDFEGNGTGVRCV